ncbi:NmrA family NAD(P)-binding protein [Roseinatronobacter alkalisoli]|uniref:NmrA family NAD(P)-binding protein n=1 Tax=Roseinatronobacter alkalisoli TaxID=3028235 RepID=A0ABT5T8Y9_9RHOB|nr:NmrA family NAD(P)-binding protein [Roseinatronobacter sp. HJB301]MDD7970637.1 NmrA family NAD(P)-binding protein [Roseinatronobacter sp. HJB301]
MSGKPKTLVMGASGLIGRPVAQALADAGLPVRAGYRSRPVDIAGADPVMIDARTGAGLREAVEGMDQLFLLIGDIPDQTEAELRVVDAARTAGVAHIVKLSTWGADTEAFSIARVHRPVERAIEQSGMSWTLLRPNCFMQNFYTYYRDMIAYTGTVRLPCDDAIVSFIDARDIAAVAARVLVDTSLRGRAYDLSGPEGLTYDQAAALLVTPHGLPVRYVNITDEECRAEMIAAGLTPAYAEDIIGLCRYYRTGAASGVTSAVEDIIGRPAVSFSRFAADHATTWQ